MCFFIESGLLNVIFLREVFRIDFIWARFLECILFERGFWNVFHLGEVIQMQIIRRH
jgi:hypothetical protein